MSILELRNLEKVYGSEEHKVHALDTIDLSLTEGEFLAVVGPTGCGKSTMLEIIGGLVEPTSGDVVYQGDSITSPHPSIGIVFQEDSSFPWRTVMGNVEFGLEMRGEAKAERRKQAQELIDLVGLSGFEDKYPNELSGGMRQRVSIARTLVVNPDILLMDEPFGALDEQTRRIIGDELLKIWEETGSTIVFVTHSITEAVHLADRILVMSARPGKIKAIRDNPLERPRDDDIMETEAFSKQTSELWSLLKDESIKGMQQSETV